MRSLSDERPRTQVEWSKGMVAINYNITEQTIETQEGEERTQFSFDTIVINKNASYAELVDAMVREQYTISDELAILRQRDDKPEEFATYNTFVESCKATTH